MNLRIAKKILRKQESHYDVRTWPWTWQQEVVVGRYLHRMRLGPTAHHANTILLRRSRIRRRAVRKKIRQDLSVPNRLAQNFRPTKDNLT